MKTKLTWSAAILLLLAAAAALPGDAARADDKKDPAPKGVWVFDASVVRVDPPLAEGAEAPGPFPELKGTTISLSWSEALGRLKKRGKTTILMDQRITTVDGVKARAHSERDVPIISINFSNSNDEQYRASVVKTGCTFQATPANDHLSYSIEALWALTPPSAKTAPQQLKCSWDGTHPKLDGKTLVLHYREQVPTAGGQASRAVEIYALITGRFLPAR